LSDLILSCIIVDDEPMALNLIQSYVEKTSFLALKAKCSNAIEALQVLNQQEINLVFLDIQMPDLSGLELSKIISKNTRIIFTTAFDQYALDGFKVEALDYLLKPFNYTEFLMASNKALTWFGMLGKPSLNKEIIKQPEKEFLFVKSEYRQLKINLKEVLLFEGLKDYIKIWMDQNPKPILTLMSLKSLENELPKDQFLRIHRSFIINLEKIEAVERSQVLIAKRRITISEPYKPDFLSYINRNSLL
jgi:two-component system response regulator LytT